MTEPRTILVVGAFRSGTSIVSGILHHLGCDMNPHPNPSIIAPRSTFEDRQLHQWCERARKKDKPATPEHLLNDLDETHLELVTRTTCGGSNRRR